MRRRGQEGTFAAACVALSAAGCASLIGADFGDYTVGVKDGSTSPSGGTEGSGGTNGTGTGGVPLGGSSGLGSGGVRLFTGGHPGSGGALSGGSGGSIGAGGRVGAGGTLTASGGKPGAGGASSCDLSLCGGCVPPEGQTCCKTDGTCGCTILRNNGYPCL